MSQFRMLLAAVAAAVAIVFIGPMVWGAPSALAAGPQPAGNHQHHMNHGNFPNNGNFNNFNNGNFRRHFNICDPDHDRDNDLCHRRFFTPRYPVYTYPVYQPTYYYYQPAVAYTAPYIPNYYWMNYGPNWNYGMPYYQVQQVCNDYNSAYGYSTAAYNSYVAGVCVSVSVNGNTVTIQITP